MPTVHEILKQSGLNDEQIAALDAKAIAAFTGVLSTAEQERQTAQQAAQKAEEERQAAAEAATKAEQERQAAAQAQEAAEVAQRSNRQFYDESIAPALNNWGNEKANLEAQLAFLKAQNEATRSRIYSYRSTCLSATKYSSRFSTGNTAARCTGTLRSKCSWWHTRQPDLHDGSH